MTETSKNYIEIGKIGATYGVKGWIKVHAYTEFFEDIIHYQPWHFLSGINTWKTLNFVNSKKMGDKIIVKFSNIDTPEEARLLTDKIIYILRSQLPILNKNEYYWSDLEGLSVINQEGMRIGTVSYLIATGTHDVLVVKDSKEFAIPYLPGKVITKVDLSAREIHVNWEFI